jgi:hypothetical protein
MSSARPAAEEPSFDPFDPEMLRTATTVDVEVEQVLTTVPVRKPKRTEFFRVHPGADYVLDIYITERDTGMEKETYLVLPNFQPLVVEELRKVRLFTTITKHGTVLLWPVKLPGDDDSKSRRIADSALTGAEQAKTLWTKLAWDRMLGAYTMFRAKGDLGEPQWPEKSFRDLLEIAFRNNIIDRADHPFIRELNGEL